MAVNDHLVSPRPDISTAFSPEGGPLSARALEGAVLPVLARAAEEAARTPDAALSQASVSADRLRHLLQIGLALSAERDIRRLLAMILSASRELTNADGGSLYIVETGADNNKKLIFRAAQNDSIVVDTNMSFAVSATSLAGYAALSGEVLRFDDVYHLPSDAPYRFNASFDQEHGYRTKSVLIVPLSDHNGDTIGVLQLINCKRHREAVLCDEASVEREVVGFDPEGSTLAMTLASQAAVALNNNLLLREIESLFEAFVVASSGAIEDRDPTTSGHSRRVTRLTLALARAVDETTNGPYAGTHFSAAQMRELRYAALLHDFGKIGVREAILTKSRKIEPSHFEAIESRIAIFQAQQNEGLARALTEIALDDSLSRPEKDAALAGCEGAARAQNEAFATDVPWLQLMNEPPAAPMSDAYWTQALSALERLKERHYTDFSGQPRPLLEDAEVSALSVRRGTLTPAEFAQIQDHAQMSWEFLHQIPWTRGLEHVPAIAQAHHERLDGSGYPLGLVADTIPLGAKMMAISDVFDALTAADRPYKRALSVEEALRILDFEAKAGKLDADLLAIFIEACVWKE